MNKARRIALAEIRLQIEEIRDVLDDLHSEEEGAAEAFPESLQESERCLQMYRNAEALEAACQYLDDAVEEIENASNKEA